MAQNKTKTPSKAKVSKKERPFDFYPEFKVATGRPLSYTPDELMQKFAEYVDWCRDHPLANTYDTTSTTQQGGSYGTLNRNIKPRLVSIGGFLVFLGSDESWWSHLEDGKRGEEFFKVKKIIKSYCEEYQKEMAAAGIFKENIISRLLGLADKKEVAANAEGLTIVVNNPDEKEKIGDIGKLGV